MNESIERAAAAGGNVWCLPESAAAASQVNAHREEGFGKMQLSESVAAHLREQIISGKLKQGDFLRIDAIAKALGTSTTPVREGLLLLQSESFVRLLPRRGFVVNSFSKDDLLDMFWAQATIGAELAARAAVRMSDADVARLEKLEAEHQRAFASGDKDIVTRLGHEFHRSINLAAQSPRLALQLGSLAKQLPNRFYTSIEGQLQGAIEYHPIIINAIGVRDQDAVRSLMFRHIISGGEHLITMLERQGAWDSASAAINVPVALVSG
ncbi:GntR family transcriptional regulator [Caballeronia novacaledonica]|uniref:GntR family transcriptional regulator n=1 Tax=Caballeronia novacaledonica TaxID=1544861 RepID=A0A2U3IDD5_9BURK|nr:GntR family transcriptional regulator [Caballeronia novacaledonica]SPB18219.1 GntR family transcriptional regulator [Caballeronia novacaledonica]